MGNNMHDQQHMMLAVQREMIRTVLNELFRLAGIDYHVDATSTTIDSFDAIGAGAATLIGTDCTALVWRVVSGFTPLTWLLLLACRVCHTTCQGSHRAHEPANRPLSSNRSSSNDSRHEPKHQAGIRGTETTTTSSTIDRRCAAISKHEPRLYGGRVATTARVCHEAECHSRTPRYPWYGFS